MKRADRLRSVLEALSASGTIDVTGMAHEFGVSTATVRRDLQLLEDRRLLSRTHGGAVSNGVLSELPLRYRAHSTRRPSAASPPQPSASVRAAPSA